MSTGEMTKIGQNLNSRLQKATLNVILFVVQRERERESTYTVDLNVNRFGKLPRANNETLISQTEKREGKKKTKKLELVDEKLK